MFREGQGQSLRVGVDAVTYVSLSFPFSDAPAHLALGKGGTDHALGTVGPDKWGDQR